MTPKKTLAEQLAPMTMAEIDAMSDAEVALLMGAPEAPVPEAWALREAAKAATNEYAEKVLTRSKSVPTEQLERYRQMGRGGRPRLGAGESVQIRARLSPDMAKELNQLAADTGKVVSELVRLALEALLVGGRKAVEVAEENLARYGPSRHSGTRDHDKS